MNVEILEIMAPALAIGLIVGVVHAPLGIEVLRRGIVFIDLATAQLIGLGIIVVETFWHDLSWVELQTAILGVAIFAALFFSALERILPREQEAVIGCTFIVAASASLLVVADGPHGGESLRDILSGQILFADWLDLLAVLPVYAGAVAAWYLIPAVRTNLPFFILFAVTVGASVQLVGVYVVFASLILPALAARGDHQNLSVALLCSVIAVVSGIVLSTVADLPAGPVLVMCYAASATTIRAVQAIRRKQDRGVCTS